MEDYVWGEGGGGGGDCGVVVGVVQIELWFLQEIVVASVVI